MTSLDRRSVLKGAAVLAVWSTPIVATVDVASAAQLHSQPTTTPTTETIVPPIVLPPEQEHEPPKMGPALPDDLPGELAFTGDHTARDAKVAAAAIAAGTAAIAAAGRQRPAL